MTRAKVQAGGILRKGIDNRWQTPEYILEAVRAYFGGPIPIDPASAPGNPTRALRFYAPPGRAARSPSLFADPASPGEWAGPDGLAAPWDEGVFCNPPYSSGELRPYLRKAQAEFQRLPRRPIIYLLPCNRWEVGYFTNFLDCSNAWCFHAGRVPFISAIDGKAVAGNPFASFLVGLGVDVDAFDRAFGDLGPCYSVERLYPVALRGP